MCGCFCYYVLGCPLTPPSVRVSVCGLLSRSALCLTPPCVCCRRQELLRSAAVGRPGLRLLFQDAGSGAEHSWRLAAATRATVAALVTALRQPWAAAAAAAAAADATARRPQVTVG